MDDEVERRGGRRKGGTAAAAAAAACAWGGDARLVVTGVDDAEQQQKSSPPVTSAESFPLSLVEPDVVDAGVVFGVAVRRERSVMEKCSGGLVGVGKQQQLRPLQQQQQ